MAFLDRIVDGATILKINGNSSRANRPGQAWAGKRPKKYGSVDAGGGRKPCRKRSETEPLSRPD